jgi:hypothetical protein
MALRINDEQRRTWSPRTPGVREAGSIVWLWIVAVVGSLVSV